MRDGSRAAATVGRWDTLRFNALQTLPQLLRGMFVRRPRTASMVDALNPDPQGIRLVGELCRRYDSDYLWVSVAGKPSLLVLDPVGIRRVLDHSPDVYGPPDLKVKGMSHFQPGAVTISTGDDWVSRRAFNENVLASREAVHPLAGAFLSIVAGEVEALCAPGRDVVWSQLASAFRRITAGVVFGPDAVAEPALARLDALMRRANRIVGDWDTPELRAFRGQILELVCGNDGSSLGARSCPHVQPGDPVPVAGQLPHWLFAMKDTLSTNCAFALALVAAHPDAQERAREEASRTDLSDPGGVHAMTWVEGCLRDAMRLWPTTPMIVRKAMRDDVIEGRPVEAGDQVLIHNGFNHRNPDAIADPDRFRPEAWEQGVWDYRFNALSNGPQACAGRELVLFLGKAVLGRLLERGPWTLGSPALDSDAPMPHAFDHRAMRLRPQR